MKRTYIKPDITVVALNVRDNVMISGSGDGAKIFEDGGSTSDVGGSSIEVDAREVIRTPNAWEEW